MGFFILIADGLTQTCNNPDCPVHGARNRAQAGYIDVVADVQGELATADTVRPPALLPEPAGQPTAMLPPPVEFRRGNAVYSRLLGIKGYVAGVSTSSRGLRYDVRWIGGGYDAGLFADDLCATREECEQ